MHRVIFWGGETMLQRVRAALGERARDVELIAFDGQLSRRSGFNQSLVVLDMTEPLQQKQRTSVLAQARSDGGKVLVILGWHRLHEQETELLKLADDVVFYPIRDVELLFRFDRLLSQFETNVSDEASTSFANVRFDLNKFQVFSGPNPMSLTRKEFELLLYFARHPEKSVSRESLALEFWRSTTVNPAINNALNGHICRIRAKLQEEGAGCTIRAVRGAGFKLCKDSDETEAVGLATTPYEPRRMAVNGIYP
jgi:DNA-binding response OmpR family regulator